jgi:hypothetical protein
MSDETILIWFRFSAEIKHAPVTFSTQSNRGVEFFVKSFSVKYIIPGSASATKVPQSAHDHNQSNKTAEHATNYGGYICA